jgi:cation diffusion facilitator family transporter
VQKFHRLPPSVVPGSRSSIADQAHDAKRYSPKVAVLEPWRIILAEQAKGFSKLDSAARKQRAAFASIFASVGLAIAKLAAGFFSGSLALISEGGHGALDAGATILTFFAVREGDKPADEEHPFGHAKFEAVAALAETGLLAFLAVIVAFEATRRLGGKASATVEASPVTFAVIVTAIGVDFFRWRGLARVARDTKSDALAADALHFSSDLISSVLVLIGLAATRAGFQNADALAAIGVALFIAVAGYRLGRRTIDTLVDTAPAGLARRLRGLIKTVPGVAAIDYVRLRRSGAQTIGEVGVFVSRTLPLERVAAIKANILAQIAAAEPQAALTITANPRALDDESVLERVLLIAGRRRLPVHHVTIQEIEGRRSVSLDVEVDGRMSLGEAHEIASRLEFSIKDEIGPDIEVETHIEPMETSEIPGRDADAATVQAIVGALKRGAAGARLREVHNVRVRATPGGLLVNFHCRIDPAASVDDAHGEVDALERSVRDEIPAISRIIGHVEPASKG